MLIVEGTSPGHLDCHPVSQKCRALSSFILTSKIAVTSLDVWRTLIPGLLVVLLIAACLHPSNTLPMACRQPFGSSLSPPHHTNLMAY